MGTKRETIVKNLITGEKSSYFNSYSVVDNLVTEIMRLKKIDSITDKQLREKIRKEYNLREAKSIKRDRVFSYCLEYDLYAYSELKVQTIKQLK